MKRFFARHTPEPTSCALLILEIVNVLLSEINVRIMLPMPYFRLKSSACSFLFLHSRQGVILR